MSSVHDGGAHPSEGGAGTGGGTSETSGGVTNSIGHGGFHPRPGKSKENALKSVFIWNHKLRTSFVRVRASCMCMCGVWTGDRNL